MKYWFFMFLKLHKWYQIMQSITFISLNKSQVKTQGVFSSHYIFSLSSKLACFIIKLSKKQLLANFIRCWFQSVVILTHHLYYCLILCVSVTAWKVSNLRNLRKFAYSAWVWENMNQKNSVFGHFSRNVSDK